jgi:hypothetical protein
MRLSPSVLAAVVIASAAAPAFAGFAGQIILGPLSLGSNVTGDTTNSNDDNDGFTSGDHIFDIWDGGDDAWRLDWLGGDMTITLSYAAGVDNDLFLYEPGSYDDSANYSILGTSPDVVTLLGAPAGTYYIVVDSTAGSEGPYNLSVIPAPGSALIIAAAAAMRLRRRLEN